MKRTLQTLLFALIAIMMPIVAWAEETTVQAKWGASADALTFEGTLAEAFIEAAAADGSTVGYIQLQADVAATLENQLLIDGGEFTLDLNGHTLSSDDYSVLIIYSGTHVTITGEGNMTCTASGYSTVALSEDASLTIASGTFTSTYVVFQTDGNLVINGGTFTAADDFNTINYDAGTVDLSHYSDVTGISIRKNSGASVASSTITLPSGYCFYDSNSSAVTELQPGETYTIGEEPEQKYTVTFDAGGGEGTMENGISYGGDYMLPECAFTAPEGKMFKAWQVGESEQQPGAIVNITGNTTVTALWRDYVPQITINMYDSYGDGWSGNTIIVKKNGEQIGTATIESSSYSNTVRYDYDNSAEYTFYWQLGEADNTYPEECSFEILVEDEVVFTAERYDNDNTSDCGNYTDGQLIHTIAGVPIEVETLTIADGELEVYSNNEALTTVGTLTYTRTLPNLEWNALYVPFEIPVSQLTDSYDVAYINDVHSYDNDEDGTIDELKMEVIHITAGTLNANYPYLIRAKNDEAMTMNLVITDAALYATKVNTVTCSSVFMKFDVTGTYAQMTADDLTDEEGNTSLVITTDGSWQQLAAESTLNPFRLYLTMTAIDGSPVKVAPEAARSMRIVTRGETTRIENSELKTASPADVYDLQGRRVENPTKGIYIVNGKKVVLK